MTSFFSILIWTAFRLAIVAVVLLAIYGLAIISMPLVIFALGLLVILIIAFALNNLPDFFRQIRTPL